MNEYYIRLMEDGDSYWQDLIILKNKEDIEKVKLGVEKCKKELAYEYSYDDIIKYIKKEIKDFDIIFLGDVETIYY